MKHAIRSKLSTVYTVRIDFLYVEQNRLLLNSSPCIFQETAAQLSTVCSTTNRSFNVMF